MTHGCAVDTSNAVVVGVDVFVLLQKSKPDGSIARASSQKVTYYNCILIHVSVDAMWSLNYLLWLQKYRNVVINVQ